MTPRDRLQVYAVVRIDRFQPEEVALENRVSVKEVVWSEEEARAEVDRLNGLNSDKDVHYFWQATRLVKGGRGSVDQDDHA